MHRRGRNPKLVNERRQRFEEEARKPPPSSQLLVVKCNRCGTRKVGMDGTACECDGTFYVEK